MKLEHFGIAKNPGTPFAVGIEDPIFTPTFDPENPKKAWGEMGHLVGTMAVWLTMVYS